MKEEVVYMKIRTGLAIVLAAILLAGCTNNDAPEASDDIDRILPAEEMQEQEQDGIGVEQHEFFSQK